MVLTPEIHVLYVPAGRCVPTGLVCEHKSLSSHVSHSQGERKGECVTAAGSDIRDGRISGFDRQEVTSEMVKLRVLGRVGPQLSLYLTSLSCWRSVGIRARGGVGWGGAAVLGGVLRSLGETGHCLEEDVCWNLCDGPSSCSVRGTLRALCSPDKCVSAPGFVRLSPLTSTEAEELFPPQKSHMYFSQ